MFRAAFRAPLWAVLGAVLLGGCYVPITASAPQSPRTAGQSQWGVHAAIEYPPVDLLDTVTKPPSAAEPSRYPTSAVPQLALQGSRGMGETFDLELGLHGGLYGVAPVPNGVWVGGRYHMVASKWIDLGVSGRFGYAGFLAREDEEPYDDSSLTMIYSAMTGSAQLNAFGILEPRLAVSAQPMRIFPKVEGAELDDFFGLTLSTTASISVYGIAPFITGAIITSGNTRGLSTFATVGIAISATTKKKQPANDPLPPLPQSPYGNPVPYP